MMTSSSLINYKKSMHHFNMRHGSLFSGIGGFDLASEWMGWENVFHCEWNPFGQKVLNYYWPKAISYHDITKTDFSIHRGQIDIITGGFPCQPYSTAGKRKGKEDSRHLWPQMLRAIREVQPTWIVGENVLGLVNWDGGLVFEEVQADLEAEGYEVQPYVLPAASVNAPHLRNRVFFVAYKWTAIDSNHKGRSSGSSEIQSKDGEVSEWDNYAKPSDSSIQWISSDSNSNGRQKNSEFGYSENKKNKEQFKCTHNSRNASHSDGFRLWGQSDRTRDSRFFDQKGKIGDWKNFPTVSPICSRNDGISDRLDSITFSKWRNESIKAGGNAIVPQVVHQIFKAIQQYNDLEK
jgi:DNA (cytosine-5)-methyltransferase 1